MKRCGSWTRVGQPPPACTLPTVTSEAYLKVCDGGHEVHAGVGVIREYGLTLHTQRSRTLYHLLGEPRYHRRRLADALGW